MTEVRGTLDNGGTYILVTVPTKEENDRRMNELFAILDKKAS